MSGLTRLCLFLFPVSLLIEHQLPPALAQNLSRLPSAVDSPSQLIVRPKLKHGSRGVAVSELQSALRRLGYYNGAIDGRYGEATALAVSQFQRAAGLKDDGIVGRTTWEHLFSLQTPQPSSTPNSSTISAAPSAILVSNNDSTTEPNQATSSDLKLEKLPVLKQGMRGPEVFWLQQRLLTTGFFQGNVDGIFGSDTLAAVKAAQERYGLNSDGIVGNTTWRAILP